MLLSSEIVVQQVVNVSDGGGQSLTPARTPGGWPAGPQTRLPAPGAQARSPDRGDPGGGAGGAGRADNL